MPARGGRGGFVVRASDRRVDEAARGGCSLRYTSRSWPLPILSPHFLPIFPVLPFRTHPCRLLRQLSCRQKSRPTGCPAGCFGTGSRPRGRPHQGARAALPGGRFRRGAESCCAAVGRRGQHTGNQQGGRGEENVWSAFRTRGKRTAYPFVRSCAGRNDHEQESCGVDRGIGAFRRRRGGCFSGNPAAPALNG